MISLKYLKTHTQRDIKIAYACGNCKSVHTLTMCLAEQGVFLLLYFFSPIVLARSSASLGLLSTGGSQPRLAAAPSNTIMHRLCRNSATWLAFKEDTAAKYGAPVYSRHPPRIAILPCCPL